MPTGQYFTSQDRTRSKENRQMVRHRTNLGGSTR